VLRLHVRSRWLLGRGFFSSSPTAQKEGFLASLPPFCSLCPFPSLPHTYMLWPAVSAGHFLPAYLLLLRRRHLCVAGMPYYLPARELLRTGATAGNAVARTAPAAARWAAARVLLGAAHAARLRKRRLPVPGCLAPHGRKAACAAGGSSLPFPALLLFCPRTCAITSGATALCCFSLPSAFCLTPAASTSPVRLLPPLFFALVFSTIATASNVKTGVGVGRWLLAWRGQARAIRQRMRLTAYLYLLLWLHVTTSWR